MNSFAKLIKQLDELNQDEMAQAWVVVNRSKKKLQNNDAVNKITALKDEIEKVVKSDEAKELDYNCNPHELIAKINYIYILLAQLVPSEAEFKTQCQFIVDLLFKKQCDDRKASHKRLKEWPFVSEEEARIIKENSAQNGEEATVIELTDEAKHLSLEKYSLIENIKIKQIELEKIEIMREACSIHRTHLLKKIRKQKSYRENTDNELDELAKKIDASSIDDIKHDDIHLAQLNLMNQFLSILNKTPHSHFKILNFQIFFVNHEDLIHLRKDSATKIFLNVVETALKILATIASLGLCAKLIWHKSADKQLSDNIRLTLLGSTRQSKLFDIDKQHDLKPSVMDENIPIVRHRS